MWLSLSHRIHDFSIESLGLSEGRALTPFCVRDQIAHGRPTWLWYRRAPGRIPNNDLEFWLLGFEKQKTHSKKFIPRKMVFFLDAPTLTNFCCRWSVQKRRVSLVIGEEFGLRKVIGLPRPCLQALSTVAFYIFCSERLLRVVFIFRLSSNACIFDSVKLIETDSNWLKLIETDWKWLKITRNRSKWIASRRESGEKPLTLQKIGFRDGFFWLSLERSCFEIDWSLVRILTIERAFFSSGAWTYLRLLQKYRTTCHAWWFELLWWNRQLQLWSWWWLPPLKPNSPFSDILIPVASTKIREEKVRSWGCWICKNGALQICLDLGGPLSGLSRSLLVQKWKTEATKWGVTKWGLSEASASDVVLEAKPPTGNCW